MPRRLYSLLVGIADYHKAPRLDGCLIDVDNMTSYIKGIQSSEPKVYNEVIDPIVLVDADATRDKILENLEQVTANLNSEDTLMFYYCGHGVNETSKGQFYGNYNDRIQSLYCYESSENNTLASKEIRYILHQAPKDAHILTVYDCCHSGEMSRSSKPKIHRRSASSSPKSARLFGDFIFSDKTSKEDLLTKEFNEIFPDSNVMTLAACLTREEAFGNDYGGFFTSSLLKILKANDDHINYADLLKQIDLDIRRTDEYKQAPAMSIIGDRRYDQSTSWLRMNGDHLESGQSFIKHNYKTGWIFSKGLMHGMAVSNAITIEVSDAQTAEVVLDKVNLIDSLIDEETIADLNLDPELTYKVIRTDINKITPTLSINNLDATKEVFQQVESFLSDCDLINYSDDLNEADYHVNLFNGLVYFSFPFLTYQPLNQQFNTGVDRPDFTAMNSFLKHDITILTNWYCLKHLEIKDSFSETPIRIEAKYNDSDYIDITNGTLDLVVQERLPKQYGSVLYHKIDLRITNTSDSTIHVTPLALYNSKHTISNDGLLKETIDIDPGKSKEFLNFILALENYQEIYNWEYEKMHLKILVNNYGKIDQSVMSFFQNGFNEPLTLRDTSRGFVKVDEMENPVKNALYTSEIFLRNSTIDKITGELEENLEAYMTDPKIGPFISNLYTKDVIAGKRQEKNIEMNTD